MTISENALKLLKEKQYFKDNENTWDDLCQRVSIAISDIEDNNDKRLQVQTEIYEAMTNLEFIFSTPVLLNADKDNAGQLSSCFIVQTKDSIEDICLLDAEFSKIFQRNGGAGTDLSVLRPAQSKVDTSKGYAGGVITFMGKYDNTADDMTKFNPSRKGALKINLQCWHPQLFDFIHSKDNTNKLKRMNISVSLTDDFMKAVENDEDWNLEFPDYQWNKEVYNQEWNGDLDSWRDKGYPTVIYQTLKAREVLEEIAKCSWQTGEPGTNYQSRMDIDNPNKHLSSQIFTNPCNEFSNIPYSSCNLGSINIFSCIENGKFDWEKLRQLSYRSVRWFDNMISINKLPIPKIQGMTEAIRPIGMGLMGLADAMYALGIKYNSRKGYDFAEKIIKVMKDNALKATMDLADERGVYPAWEGSEWQKQGLKVRNSSLLSIAPNGTISFLAGVSGGCEPQFGLTYSRRTYDNNIYYVTNPTFENKLKELCIYSDELMEKIENNHGSCQGIKEIPKEVRNVFVVAHDLTPKEHVNMVSTLQKYVDLSLSKTVNFSNNATVEDLHDIYIYAWKEGLKGLAVYRDGSRENQTLSSGKLNENTDDKKYVPINDTLDIANSVRLKIKTGCGSMWLTLVYDNDNNLCEIFSQSGSHGGCRGMTEGLSRSVSLLLRANVDPLQVIDQLQSVSCDVSKEARKKDKTIGKSCADSIAKQMLRFINGELSSSIKPIAKVLTTVKDNKEQEQTNNCPDCGKKLKHESGCISCVCGYSKCS